MTLPFRFTFSMISALTTIGGLALIARFPGWAAMVVICAVWLIISGVVHLTTDRGLKIAVLSAITFFAFLGVMSIVDIRQIQWLIILFAGLAEGALVQSSFRPEIEAPADYKPRRRLYVMIVIFDTYAAVSTLFAIDLFLGKLPFWLIAILCAILFSLGSFFIWEQYYELTLPHALLWMLLIFFIMTEVLWVIRLLPFDYLTASFIATWIWYDIQLFVRFHLGGVGILWRKQRWFILTNVCLFIAMLFFVVRWV